MNSTSIFLSRKEKETFLKKIINKLSITETEKEIYLISIEILDDTDFLLFYNKIVSQLPEPIHLGNASIAPLTSILL